MKLPLVLLLVAVSVYVSPASASKAAEIFKEYEKHANQMSPDHFQRITDANFLFVIKCSDHGTLENFLIDYSQFPIKVETASKKKADITIKMDDDIFVKLSEGTLDGFKAFLEGKLKISGNIMLAMKLKLLFEFSYFDELAEFADHPASKASEVFKNYEKHANKFPADHFQRITDANFLFVIKSYHGDHEDLENFLIDYSQFPIKVETASKKKPDITIKMDDDTFVKLSEGKLDGMKAFLEGKLKISGNVMLAMKLELLFKLQDDVVLADHHDHTKAAEIFKNYEKHANKFPADHFQRITDKNFLFVIKCTTHGTLENFMIDYSQFPIKVETASNKRPDITIKMDDDIFVKLSEGKLDGMKAFLEGKLKISGDYMLAMKLELLFKRSN